MQNVIKSSKEKKETLLDVRSVMEFEDGGGMFILNNIINNN
jgi:tRNA 2-selenouridine synthase SelU